MDLDIACRELCVVGALALNDLALHGDNKFAPEVLCLRVRVAGVLLVENDLRHTVTIAQIDKGEHAKVTLLRHPAHQNNALPDMLHAKLAAGVRSLKIP